MPDKKSQSLRAWVLYAVLLFLTGVTLSAVTAYLQYKQIDLNARAEFERLSARTEIEINARLDKAVHALRATRGLYAASDKPVGREEFRRFVQARDLEREFTGVRGFGFIERVERSALESFVAAQRADGEPEFAVHSLSEPHYPDLFVVKFLEPEAKNPGALGLDVGSEDLRRAGIQQAITTGAETITGKITLVQDEKKLPAFLLYVPVYRNGAPLNVPSERRAALVGVLYAPIVMDELLANIPDVVSGMLDFEIIDSPINGSGGAVLFDADGHVSRLMPGDAIGKGRRYALRKPLQLPGRGTTLTMGTTQAYEATLNFSFAWLLLAGGSLISALLALTMYQQASGRVKAERQVDVRTRDLKNALRDNEALFSTLNLHAIVSISDRSGRIIEVNDAFCEISGYSREELLGQDHRIVNSSVQPSAFWGEVWQTIASGKPWRGQVCNLGKHGQFYWVDTVIAPIIGNDENIEKYISIRTDITAIKKAEEELRWRQSLLDKMSNSSPLAFLVVDNRNDAILYINHRCLELWGVEALAPRIERGELKHREFTQASLAVLVDGQTYLESCKPLQSELNRLTLEDEIAFTQGRTVRRYSTQIRDSEDQYYGRFYIFEDITERKNAERAITDATQAAQAASLSKSQFLANMSHEIRTPMNAILGLLNLLQSTELTAQQRDYASKTEGAAQSLLGLLNDILDFSKVEAGKMTLENEPFRIDKILRNLSVVLSANLGSKNIEILFDVDPELPPMLRGDAMRLQQVLTNLGGNAVKFTAQGQVIMALRVLDQSDEQARIEFSVKDTGIGIAPEHQAHIFSGFSQAEGSTTRRFGGTGLGLAISKRFVELMGGSIHIDSAPGVGSTFRFVLDLAKVSDEVLQAHSAAAPSLKPQRVLVIDDNPVAGTLAQGMVNSWGWPADLASSGSQALQMVAEQIAQTPGSFPYPVVFTDWRLPDLDGWETSRRLRQLAQTHQMAQPLILMVTSQGRELLAQRSEGDQDLLNGFLVKPVTAPMLYDALQDAAAGKSGMRKMTKGRSNARLLSGMRILVVEDNLINQQVADELLSASGAIVSLAANGQIGVDAVAAAAPQFDAVLMDVQMPVLDGYGATRAIREELGLRELPIIAMTANAMASDREVCLAAGMSEHIGKPFDMDKLVALLLRMTGFQASRDAGEDLHTSPAELAELPKITGLDLATALARMSGMRGLYVRTARDFQKIMASVQADLQQCVQAQDLPQASMRLHTLKGNAATLGLRAMAAWAAQLEKRCKSDPDLQACAQHLPELASLVDTSQVLLDRAIDALRSSSNSTWGSLARAPGNAPTPMPSAAALKALERLSALAGADDLQALQCFAEDRASLDTLGQEALEQLERALQDLDLAAAHALCEALRSKVAPTTAQA